MFRILTVSTFLLLAGFNFALSQSYLYSYSGDSSAIDVGSKAIETFDGNIVVSGFTTWSSWGYDGILMKLNLSGDTLWTRTFGDTAVNNQITGGYVTQLADSGFLLVYSLTNQSCNDFILFFRLNVEGDTIWTKRFGFAQNKTDYIHCVIETPDNGFIAVGASDHGGVNITDMRGLVMKLDSNGDTLWTKTFKSFRETYFQDIKQTPESDYIICGTSLDADSTNGFYINLLKIDESGNNIWIKYLGLPGFSSARNVIVSDNGYLVTGETVINNNSRNYILKTDSAGNSIWCKKYELAPYIGVSSKLTKCASGGYYFSENVCDTTFIWKSLLLKIDDFGLPLWSKLYDGKPVAYINGIFGTIDGGCILTGQYSDTLNDFPSVFFVEQDLLIIKTDSTGFVNCHYDQTIVTYDSLLASEVFLPLLISSGMNQYNNPIVVKSGYSKSMICSTTGVGNNYELDNILNVYPNPSTGLIYISNFSANTTLILKLYDIQGNLVAQKINYQNVGNLITFEIKYPEGLYLLQLIENDKSYFKKIIITSD